MALNATALPRCCPPGATVFLTWRLYGALPRGWCDRARALPDSGHAFAQTDRLLDMANRGPLWLRDQRIASLVAIALELGERHQLYDRFAWVVMPNHVHVVMRPHRPMPVVMKYIADATEGPANRLLGRSGNPFWQRETYERCIHTADEFHRVVQYVEHNPVRANLARSKADWTWSSAGLWQTRAQRHAAAAGQP